jgi:hypothetical protein
MGDTNFIEDPTNMDFYDELLLKNKSIIVLCNAI